MAKKFVENKERVERLIEYIKIGCSIKGACGGVGIDDTTYYNALSIARKQLEEGMETSPEIEFFYKIKNAEREFETRNLELIKSHAVDDWKAAAWLLERRRQHEYVVRQDIALGLPEKITINMDVKPDAN